MARGSIYPSEAVRFEDAKTGAQLRQISSHPSIHHHPFFMIPAYDDAMKRLVFVSHRTGRPEIFAELRDSGLLQQLTEQEGLAEYSLYPSPNGSYVYYTAFSGAWRLSTDTLEPELLLDFGDASLRSEGMVADAMGTTALSHDDRYWAIRFNTGGKACLAIIDTQTGKHEVILQRDTISHMMFCPDDNNLLFYAGPLNDRVWLINRDGSGNRRLYKRKPGEWITHEVWLPKRFELAFVDWPKGIRAINVQTGKERLLSSFNAWHAVANPEGKLMVADTNFPDNGLQLFNPHDSKSEAVTLCYPEASSLGEHWAGPFPYEHGPIKVYAPQHTHPHPSFSPDGKHVVFTSDRSGFAQIYELELAPFLERIPS
ncbi:MAG: PD40 domain-containing protein [Trueperaceae bacterium]|nr:PD40 domain-containing protein [Trueperaceae bacterium]